jgi:hypothetical protein
VAGTFANLSNSVACPSAHVLDCGARAFAYLTDRVTRARSDILHRRACTRTYILHS